MASLGGHTSRNYVSERRNIPNALRTFEAEFAIRTRRMDALRRQQPFFNCNGVHT